MSRQVYTIYIFFAKNSDEEISQKAIVGLGECLVFFLEIHTM